MSKRAKWTLAALLLAALLCLTGCHGSRQAASFAVPESFDAQKQYQITFWAKNDTNVTQTRIYEKAISDFEALYPNITVNLRLYTDYGKIYNDVITNIATGTTPNVCITYPDHIATYMTGDQVMVDLDSLAADAKYGFGGSELRYDGPKSDEMIDRFLQECRIGGKLYALPYMRSTEACYINKTYVEALGYQVPEVLTWDYIWEVSEAAMKKTDDGLFAVNGQKVLIPFIYKSTDNMMISMLKQKDAGYSDAAGNILLFSDTTRDLLYTIGEHGKSRAFSTFKISSYPANFLNAGQCIFAIDSTAGATWMGTDAPLCDIAEDAIVEFETVVRMIPQFDTTQPQMISQGPSVCVFNKADPNEVLASWLFAQYLLTNEVQIAYAETEGYVPVTAKAQDSAEYREYLARRGEDNSVHYSVKIDATRLLLDHIGDTFTTAVFNGSTSLRDAAGQLVENVVKSMRRKEVVDDAYMDKLYADVTSLFRLDQITAGGAGKAELGPLPDTAVQLLCLLAAAWVCMGAVVIRRKLRTKAKKN